MKNDVASAIEMIEEALEKDSTFREADSLLVFEVRPISHSFFLIALS